MTKMFPLFGVIGWISEINENRSVWNSLIQIMKKNFAIFNFKKI